MARHGRWRWSGYALSLAGASVAHGAALTGAAFVGVHAIQARERALAEASFAVLVRRAPEGPLAEIGEPPRGVELALSDAGDEEAEPKPLELPPELLPAAEPLVPPEPEPAAELPPPADPIGPVWVPEVVPEPEPVPVPEVEPELALPAAAPEPAAGPGPEPDPLAAAADKESQRSPGAAAGEGTAAAGGPPPGPPPGTADGTGSGGVLVRVADLRPPVPLASPDPEYPHLARRLGEEGSVLCVLHVDAKGRVSRVEVARSSGHARLDEAAVQRLRTWTFRPATLDGAPVAGTYRHRVRFELRS